MARVAGSFIVSEGKSPANEVPTLQCSLRFGEGRFPGAARRYTPPFRAQLQETLMIDRGVLAEYAGEPVEPDRNCGLCPRLVDFRNTQRAAHPDWYNAPVPTFGKPSARLLIAGLAPGLRGANRTGRAFTGDYAGDLLYETMSEFGFARGIYRADPNDGFELVDAAISNSVRCVPPENKPTTDESTPAGVLCCHLGELLWAIRDHRPGQDRP
jgi:Uracil-DNA glycosylase